jgi:hypothetical protein
LSTLGFAKLIKLNFSTPGDRLSQGKTQSLHLSSSNTMERDIESRALQAHIASVNIALLNRDDAIQLAEDNHYAAIARAERTRKKEFLAAGKLYDSAASRIEKAFSKVLKADLRANYRETRLARREAEAAKIDEAMLRQALPFIRREAKLTGINKLIAAYTVEVEERRVQTGNNLSLARSNAAKDSGKVIPDARKKKATELSKALRALNKAKAAASRRFNLSKRLADSELRTAKLAANRQFAQTSADRKQAWKAYIEQSQAAQQALLSSLARP